MTSWKLMSSSVSRNSDHIIRRKSSPSSLSSSSSSSTKPHDLRSSVHHNNGSNNSSNNLDSTSMIFHNLYMDNSQGTETSLLNAEITLLDAAGAIAPISDSDTAIVSPAPSPARKTADDVWREIVEGKRKQRKAAAVAECKEEMMTLEDFLVKAGAVEEEAMVRDAVKVEIGSGIYAFDAPYMVTSQQSVEVRFGNEMEVIGGGRGKRKAILEPLDKTMMQRQRRMIKNRESAARSRERKQAYQVELESMVFRLEEEKEQLLKEKAKRTKEHYKQLIQKVIPVVEKRRPPCFLRRVKSMHW